MRVRCGAGVFVLFSFFSLLLGQSLVSDIVSAHGGQSLAKTGKYQISGTVTLGGRTMPFVLKADGEKTRLEMESAVSVKQGMIEQLVQEGRRSYIRPVRHGAQDLYLVPFLALRELAIKYQATGRLEGRDAFAHRPRLERFVAYEPDIPVIRATFDPETHLLAEVAFLAEDSPTEPVRYLYSDYTTIGGVALARRVEHWIGSRLFQEFTIQSVDFNPVVSTSDFTIEH